MKCLLIALKKKQKKMNIFSERTNLDVKISKCFDMFAMTNIIILSLIENISNRLLHFSTLDNATRTKFKERTNVYVNERLNSIRTSNKDEHRGNHR